MVSSVRPPPPHFIPPNCFRLVQAETNYFTFIIGHPFRPLPIVVLHGSNRVWTIPVSSQRPR